MKTISMSLSVLVVLVLAGCASQSQVAVNQPVGPSRPHLSRHKGEGALVVYSAPEVTDQAETYFPTHSSYAIYSLEGSLIKKVDNRTGSFDQSPVAIELPAGEYEVRARARNVGHVQVKVVIEENRTTVVHLDARMRLDPALKVGNKPVRLPDGQIVGETADSTASAMP